MSTKLDINCPEGKKCKVWDCALEHPKSRTWVCQSAKLGKECTKPGCLLLHRPKAEEEAQEVKSGAGAGAGGKVKVKEVKPCLSDEACMDCACRFSHTKRRQTCLRLDSCCHGMCPWLHPYRGFEKTLNDASLRVQSISSAATATPSPKSSPKSSPGAHDPPSYTSAVSNLSYLRNRLFKVRTAAMVMFAQASDRQMQSEAAGDASIEQAKCTEIKEQLDAFDYFTEPAFQQLLKLHERQAGEAAVSLPFTPEVAKQMKELTRRINREIYRLECSPKPALARRQQIMAFLQQEDCQSVVVRGDTGSGKSTQLPQYIAELILESNAKAKQAAVEAGEEIPRERKVICTQPRKVAAVSLAERVNEEWAAINTTTTSSSTSSTPTSSAQKPRAPPVVPDIGNTIGYRVGNKGRKSSRRTVVEYVTEAILLQDILYRGAAALKDVSVVILDEAHERSVTLDILIGRIELIRAETGRKDLKVVVTSATLDVQLFSAYYKGCPRWRSRGACSL